MRIAVFGMTADPFTIAHRKIIDGILEQGLADKVDVYPTIVSYHRKDKTRWLDYDDRIRVIQAALPKDDKRVNLYFGEMDRFISKSDSEVKESFAASRRYIHTLCDLISDEKRRHATCDVIKFKTVIGLDEFLKFKTWFAWEQIVKLSSLVVVTRRHTHKSEEFWKLHDEIMEMTDVEILDIGSEYLDVSASDVRKVFSGGSVDSYIEYLLGQIESGTVQRIFYKCPIFKVVQLKEVAPGFKPTGVIAPEWATVIVEKDGKYLMVKQLRYGLMKECIEFPCGQVEDGEDPRVAARRELKEETGYVVSIDDVKDLGTFDANPAFMSNRMHYFYVNLDKADYQEGSTSFDEHEKITSSWEDKALAKERFRKERGSVFIAGAFQALEWFGL